MRAAAVISLLVAIVLGIAAIGNYASDENKRDQVTKHMWSGVHQTAETGNSGEFDSAKTEADELDQSERTDGIMGLIAVTFLIGSLVMFSKSKEVHETPKP